MPESVPAANLPTGFIFAAEPMTLLDLDAAGLDPTQPAPAEFVQFLYDNSRVGYLTLWSHVLAQPNGGAAINKWINDALAVYHARALQIQMAPVGDKPSGDGVTEVTYGGTTTPAAPVNIDVPAVTGDASVGGLLTCTMGNWGNEPVSYAYQWSNGANVGDGSSSYTVAEADAGTQISCVVTATNAGGSTAAPASNALAIPGTRAAAPKEEVETRHTRRVEEDTTRSNDHGRRR